MSRNLAIQLLDMPWIFVLLFRCVFVDAGVASIDIETRKMKEEMKMKEAQAKAMAEHGELALITVDNPQTTAEERIKLRRPMLQVVNLTSMCEFQVYSWYRCSCYLLSAYLSAR